MSVIYSLVYQPAASEQVEPYHYNRVRVTEVTLIADHGIDGDHKAGRNPNRQLNIMTYETQEALRTEGYKTNPGELGEQIAVSGLDVDALQAGDRIRLGETAIAEIVKPRTGCEWFEKIQGLPRSQVQNRVGMMAKVIAGGVVREGDPVALLEPLPAEPAAS